MRKEEKEKKTANKQNGTLNQRSTVCENDI